MVERSRYLIDLLLPIVIAILVFLVALAINDAIITTIDYLAIQSRLIPNREIGAKWLYVIVLIIIIICVVYFGYKAYPEVFRPQK